MKTKTFTAWWSTATRTQKAQLEGIAHQFFVMPPTIADWGTGRRNVPPQKQEAVANAVNNLFGVVVRFEKKTS